MKATPELLNEQLRLAKTMIPRSVPMQPNDVPMWTEIINNPGNSMRTVNDALFFIMVFLAGTCLSFEKEKTKQQHTQPARGTKDT